MLSAQGKYADAETRYREALEMGRRVYGKQDHPELGHSLNNLAIVLQDQGKYADAETFSREALEMMRRLYVGRDHRALADAVNNRALVLHEQGKHADAETFMREKLAPCVATGEIDGDAARVLPDVLSAFLDGICVRLVLDDERSVSRLSRNIEDFLCRLARPRDKRTG